MEFNNNNNNNSNNKHVNNFFHQCIFMVINYAKSYCYSIVKNELRIQKNVIIKFKRDQSKILKVLETIRC